MTTKLTITEEITRTVHMLRNINTFTCIVTFQKA